MAYQSLYRRYRPGTFGEIAGQDHVVAALRNAIRDDRTGHAYLFSGPRGTGKTSTARIMAKALNCTNLGDDGEPCNECESCQAFLAGTSYDLHELDAASNNGVEAVRDLITKVALGSPGRTKVYILDEVHMLTSGAENALLKTLEEPPEHVKFVLATTEPHKVVPTIRSRTQHLRFELLPAEVATAHARFVADDADLGVDDDVIAHVVRAGGGSMRDTLSELDQVVAAGGVHGDGDAVAAIVDALASVDSAAAMVSVEGALRSGRDPRVIGESVLGRLRDAFLAAIEADLSHLPDADRQRAMAVAATAGPARLTRSMESLGTALVDMRQAPDPRVDLEVALLRLTRPDLDTDVATLVERIDRLERGAPTAEKPVAAEPVGSDEAQSTMAEATAPTEAETGPAETAPSAEVETSPVEAAVPTSAGGSPAEAARQRLAASHAADGSGAAAKPSLGALRGSAPGPPASTAAAESAAATTAASAAPSETATPTDPAAEPEAADAVAPEPVDVGAIWDSVVLPGLTKKARARFQGGHLASTSADGATFALPNQIHRDRCQEVCPEVDAILARHFGRRVRFDLVVDATPTTTTRSESSDTTDADADEDTIDVATVADLADADAEPTSGIDRLTEAFPGAEVVDPTPSSPS